MSVISNPQKTMDKEDEVNNVEPNQREVVHRGLYCFTAFLQTLNKDLFIDNTK